MRPRYLIRHAYAGRSDAWEGDDRLRGLEPPGPAVAAAIPRLLADRAVACVLSSPYLRCIQTVTPLADALGQRLELRDELADGAPAAVALELVRSSPDRAAFCLHGSTMRELLPGRKHEKGCIWVVDVDGDELAAVAYLPPVESRARS